MARSAAFTISLTRTSISQVTPGGGSAQPQGDPEPRVGPHEPGQARPAATADPTDPRGRPIGRGWSAPVRPPGGLDPPQPARGGRSGWELVPSLGEVAEGPDPLERWDLEEGPDPRPPPEWFAGRSAVASACRRSGSTADGLGLFVAHRMALEGRPGRSVMAGPDRPGAGRRRRLQSPARWRWPNRSRLRLSASRGPSLRCPRMDVERPGAVARRRRAGGRRRTPHWAGRPGPWQGFAGGPGGRRRPGPRSSRAGPSRRPSRARRARGAGSAAPGRGPDRGGAATPGGPHGLAGPASCADLRGHGSEGLTSAGSGAVRVAAPAVPRPEGLAAAGPCPRGVGRPGSGGTRRLRSPASARPAGASVRRSAAAAAEDAERGGLAVVRERGEECLGPSPCRW